MTGMTFNNEGQESAPVEQAYVLGTHDDEIIRLGLQHRVWRPHVLEAWQRAEIGPGQTILDIGCGPGYASIDLAELVGPSGQVIAIDKSERFLNTLDQNQRQRGLENIKLVKADLDAGEFPSVSADQAWCRWVFAFLKNPREVLARMASAMKPAGIIVVHEYFEYATWRGIPHCAELDRFVAAVMASWRAAGGEPNIALSLPAWLQDLGFTIKIIRPIISVSNKNHMVWSWLRTFFEVGCRRLVELGYMSSGEGESVWRAFLSFESAPGSRMISPGVLEIIAALPD
jgi:SAM-dependent methyltransferase